MGSFRGARASAVFIAMAACSTPDTTVDLNTLTPKVCTAGRESPCTCENSGPGTKRCNPTGTAFAECRISDELECGVKSDSGPPINLCGNSKIDPGEACDDGNAADDDFCTSLCLPKGDPVGAGVCPGVPVHLWGSEVIASSANVLPYKNSYNTDEPCVSSRGLYGNDRVYAITAHRAGTLHVESSGASFDVVLFVNSTCLDQKTQVACANQFTGTNFSSEMLDVAIKKDQTLYVIVDGGAVAATGDAKVAFSLQ
jgi:cysteine-rich repeat protein